MDQIQITARFSNIPSRNLVTFKELATQALEIRPSTELVAATAGLQLSVYPPYFQGK